MLLQVLRLTQEQVSQLPPAERDAILALVSPSCETHDDDRPTFISDLNSVVLHSGRRRKWRVYSSLHRAIQFRRTCIPVHNIMSTPKQPLHAMWRLIF
jgi:hypothetical protein